MGPSILGSLNIGVFQVKEDGTLKQEVFGLVPIPKEKPRKKRKTTKKSDSGSDSSEETDKQSDDPTKTTKKKKKKDNKLKRKSRSNKKNEDEGGDDGASALERLTRGSLDHSNHCFVWAQHMGSPPPRDPYRNYIRDLE